MIKLTNQTYIDELTLKNFLNDYKLGMLLKELEKKYNIPASAGNVIFLRYNIQKRTSGQSRQKRQIRNDIIDGLKTTIKCQICGKIFKSLIEHIKMHNISLIEYKNKFGKMMSEYTVFLKSHKKSESHKKKLSNIMKRRWKNGDFDSKEIREKYRTFLGKHHTEKHKEYMRNLYKGRVILWKDKIKKSHWTKGNNVEDIIDKIMKSSNTGYVKGYYISKKTKIREYYHSSYELNRMIELDDDVNVKFWTKRHKIRIKYVVDKKNRIFHKKNSKYYYFNIYRRNKGICEKQKGI